MIFATIFATKKPTIRNQQKSAELGQEGDGLLDVVVEALGDRRLGEQGHGGLSWRSAAHSRGSSR